jgi:hypothetical protein
VNKPQISLISADKKSESAPISLPREMLQQEHPQGFHWGLSRETKPQAFLVRVSLGRDQRL